MTRLSLFLLALTACDLAPKPSGGDTSDTGGSGGDGSPSAYTVNDGTVLPGTVLTLEGLVVTSGLTRDGEGFFVADPAGGPRSGLYVWGGPALVGDPAFAVGDEVTVTGEVQDFYGWIEFKINGFDVVTVTGSATVPAPEDLGDGAGVDWSQYESVAVSLTGQTVTGIDSYNTATLSSGVMLDDGFQFLDLQCGGAFDRVGGIVFYRYEAHSVNPRGESDLGTYTPGSSATATVADVQAGATCGEVRLEGVVATSVDFGDEESTFFVQDPATGAGVAVFTKGALFDVEVGDVLDLTGGVQEFYDLTEVVVTDLTTLTKTGTATPVATELAAAPSDWEPYEGQLLTLRDVEVTSEASYGQVATNYAGLFVDDLFVRFTSAPGQVWSRVTGVLHYSYGEWKLEPRTLDDIVTN